MSILVSNKNTKFHENPFTQSEGISYERTEVTKTIENSHGNPLCCIVPYYVSRRATYILYVE
jgi:hypothetical protein